MRNDASPWLKPLAVAVSALTAAIFGIGTMLALPAMASTGTVDVTWTNTSEWTTGVQAAVTIENRSAGQLTGWQVRFTYGNTVSSIWDATQTPTAGGFIAKAPAYAANIAAGGKAAFGLVGTKVAGAALIPTGCTVILPTGAVPIACAINGALSAAVPTSPTPTSPTATPTPTPTPTKTPTPTPTPTSTAPVTASGRRFRGCDLDEHLGVGRRLPIVRAADEHVDVSDLARGRSGSPTAMSSTVCGTEPRRSSPAGST